MTAHYKKIAAALALTFTFGCVGGQSEKPAEQKPPEPDLLGRITCYEGGRTIYDGFAEKTDNAFNNLYRFAGEYSFRDTATKRNMKSNAVCIVDLGAPKPANFIHVP